VWVLLAEEVERGPGSMRRVAMFTAVAAGVLIKGPVMLAWALGGSLGTALLLRAWAPLRWLRWPLGWLIVLGAAGGWFALASARYPEYPHYAFVEESLERVTTGSFHREHPLWFVPVILIAGALPWSLATPWTTRVSRMARVGLGFVLFAVLFFTASHSKLATYLLPCFPPLALVAAESWHAAGNARRGAWAVLAAYAALDPFRRGRMGMGEPSPEAHRPAAPFYGDRARRRLRDPLGNCGPRGAHAPERALDRSAAGFHPGDAGGCGTCPDPIREYSIRGAACEGDRLRRPQGRRSVRGLLQRGNRVYAGGALHSSQRARRRDDEHLSGPLSGNIARAGPVDNTVQDSFARHSGGDRPAESKSG